MFAFECMELVTILSMEATNIQFYMGRGTRTLRLWIHEQGTHPVRAEMYK
jgi:hypothetical protein